MIDIWFRVFRLYVFLQRVLSAAIVASVAEYRYPVRRHCERLLLCEGAANDFARGFAKALRKGLRYIGRKDLYDAYNYIYIYVYIYIYIHYIYIIIIFIST